MHRERAPAYAFGAYAVACLALVGLFYFLAFRTGGVRTRAKAVVNPEDVRVYAGASVVEIEHPDVQRVKRAHMSLLENSGCEGGGRSTLFSVWSLP